MKIFALRTPLLVFASMIFCLSLALFAIGHLVDASEAKPKTPSSNSSNIRPNSSVSVDQTDSILADEARKFDQFKRGLPTEPSANDEAVYAESRARLCRMSGNAKLIAKEFANWTALGPPFTEAIGDPCAANSFRSPMAESKAGQFSRGAISADGDQLLGGTINHGALLKKANGEWQSLFSGAAGFVAFNQDTPQIMYAAGAGLTLKKTEDGGAQCFDASNGIEDAGLFVAAFAMDPNNSQTLWAGGQFLWRTTDGAASWVRAGTISRPAKFSAMAIAPGNPNLALAATSEGFIYRNDQAHSSEANTNWKGVKPRDGFVSSLAFDPANPHIVYATYSTFGGAHVWRSFDAGATWSAIDGAEETALPDVPAHALAIDPRNSSRLFLGTDLGLFVTDDGGQNWRWLSAGFGADVVEWLSVRMSGETTELFAFTRRSGVWSARFSPEQTCQYTLSASARSFEAAGASGAVDVTATGTNCAWTASSEVAWVTFTAGIPGNGNGKVQFNVAANTTAMARRGRLVIAGREFIVLQAGVGGTCAATPISPGVIISGELTEKDCPSSQDVFALSYADRFSFSGVAGERISIVSFSSEILTYIYLLGPRGNVIADSRSSFSGRIPSQSGELLVLPETGIYTIEIFSRISNVKVGKYQFLLTVAPSNCAIYDLSSGKEVFDAEGGTGRVQLFAPSGCLWRAITNADWVKFPSGAQGSGNNFLNLRVEPNTSAFFRTASVEVGGRTLAIEQAGVGGSCLPKPIKFNEAVKGSLNRSDCTSASGFPYYIDRYSFTANAGQLINVRGELATLRALTLLTLRDSGGTQLSARNNSIPAENDYLVIPATGTYVLEIIAVSSGNFALSGNHDYVVGVFSPPAGCGYSLTAAATQFNAEGGKTTIDLSSQSNCAWQSVSYNDWLTFNKTSGTGRDKLELTVAPNTSSVLRQGLIAVGGKTIRFIQAGVGGSCAPTRITPGQTVTGTLNAADCPNPYALSSFPQTYADQYVFSGRAGEQVAFDQSGVRLLILTTSSGIEIARNAGQLPVAGTIVLPADGDYLIWAGSDFSQASYQFTFSLIPAGCSYSISPRQNTFGAEGGNGTIAVSAISSCGWNAVTNADWVTLTGQNGSGNGTISYKVAANSTDNYRTAVVSVGGQNFQIEQAGANGGCSAVPITPGQIVNGQLTSGDCVRPAGAFNNFRTPSDQYTFTGQAGQQIVINALVPTGASSGLGVTLYSQNGTRILSSRVRLPESGYFSLPQSGVYTIQIESSTSSTSTILNYSLSLSLVRATCSFLLSSDLARFDAAADAGSVSVMTTANCPWQARLAGDAASWVTITSGASGNDGGKVEFSLAANTTAQQRTAALVIGEQTFTIEQAGVGGNCVFVPINPGRIVGKTTAADCKKQGFFANTFVPVDRYSFVGKVGDQVSFSVFPLNSGASIVVLNSRGAFVANNQIAAIQGLAYLTLNADDTYIIEVSGPNTRDNDYTLLFEKVAPVCGYAVLPASQTFGADGGSGALNLFSTVAECPWTATSAVTWITLNGAETGKGSGKVNFTVAPNVGATLRTGTIQVGGQQLTVQQAGAAGNCAPVPIAIGQTVNGALSNADCPATRYTVPSVAFYADRYLLDFTAGQQFAVTVAASSSFVPLVQIFDSDGVMVTRGRGVRFPASGFLTLPATGKYVVEISSDSSSNGGAYSLQLVAPTQCAVSFLPDSTSFERAAGTGSLNIVTAANCNWAAASSASWLTLMSAASGTGSGKLDFKVAANPSSNLRTATIKVGDQMFTVRQAGASGSCAVTPITAGQKVTGSLTRGDCPARYGALGNSPYADYFSFSAKAGEVVDVAAFDKVRMMLIGPNGLPANSFANSGGSVPAWPVSVGVTGAYILEYSSTNIGDYELTLTINQASCVANAVAESSGIFTDAGGSFTVKVQAADGCPWNSSIVPNPNTGAGTAWITVSAGATGSGNGSATFTVAPNNGQGRYAEVSVGNQRFTLRQAAKGGSCTPITLTPGQPHSGVRTYSFACNDGVFRFDGVAGERIFVQLDDAVYNVFMQLYGPDGWKITNTSNRRFPASDFLTLPLTGVYTLTADLRSNTDERYTILLTKLPAGCSFSLSNSVSNFEFDGGAGSVKIATSANCPWTITAPPNWLKFDSSVSGSGESTINFTVAPNNSLFTRTAQLLIGGQPFTVRQAGFGGICSTRPIAPGETVFSTLDEADCRGTTTDTYVETFSFSGKLEDQALVSVSNPAVTATLIAPDGRRFRSEGALFSLPMDGVYVIQTSIESNSGSLGADYQLRLAVSSSACRFVIAPDRLTLESSGGMAEIKITTDQNCPWVARSSASWVKIVSGESGAGNGVVTVSVDANTGSQASHRQTSLSVAGRNIVVEQTGPNASCAPKALTVNSTVSGSISNSSCRAKFAPAFSFYYAETYSIVGKQGDQIAATLQRGAGTFSGYYLSLVDSNGNLLVRTLDNRLPLSGLLALPADGVYRLEVANSSSGTYTLAVVSSPAGCEAVATPTTREFDAAGGSGNFNIQSGASCSWQVVSIDNWVTINSGANGAGAGTVNFTIAANTTTQSRSATLLVNGRPVTIRQAGTAGSCAVRPITPGQSVAGTWTQSDCPSRYVANVFGTQADLYSFNAKAGDRLSAALTTTISEQSVYLTLIAPNGQRIVQTNGRRLPLSVGSLLLPSDGLYLLEVVNGSSSSFTSNYGLLLTVEPACVFAVATEPLTIPSAGGMAEIAVTSLSGCDWMATSDSDWLVIEKSFGSGTGKVGFIVAPNTAFTERIATLVIAGQTRTVKQAANSAHVSSASFQGGELARGSMVTAYGASLATRIEFGTPPKPNVAGTTVNVFDSKGVTRDALISYASPTQVNYLLPEDIATGLATVFVLASDGRVASSNLTIVNVAPSLFAANSDGKGVMAGVVLRIKADGSRSYEPIARYDETARRFVAVPIDLGPATDQLYLVGFGSGFRFRSSPDAAKAQIGGVEAVVQYAGQQPDTLGFDQLNLLLPRSIAGRGEVEIVLTVDGKTANRVSINVR